MNRGLVLGALEDDVQEVIGEISSSGQVVAGMIGQRGAPGNGITSISKTSTSGLVDTYTITYTNGDTTTFNVTNGDKGDKGDPGAIKFEIVAQLPTHDIEEDTIYLVPITPDTQHNNYEEYIYVNGQWELLGKIGVHVDLSGYATKNDIKVVFNDGEQTYTWTTSQAMFDYIATNIGSAIQSIFDELSGKQTTANMEQTINSSSTNYKYPSSQAVYNYGNTILDISSYQTGDIINNSSMVAKIKDERTIIKYNNIWFRLAAIYGTGYIFTVMSGTEYGQWITLNYRSEYDDFYFYEVGTANWEVPSNKVTSLSSSSTDTQYPSAKCVYDLVGNINSILDSINNEVI